jgi:hypothetical protein
MYSQEYLRTRRYTVYILSDRHRGRYVGLTCRTPEYRAYSLRNGNNLDVAAWLSALHRRGEEVAIKVVGVYRSKTTAKLVEGRTMVRLRAEGFRVKNHIFPRQSIMSRPRKSSVTLAVDLPARLKSAAVRRAKALGIDIHVLTEQLYRQALNPGLAQAARPRRPRAARPDPSQRGGG